MLRARILTVAVLLPCFLLLLFFSPILVWSLVLLTVVFAASFEWARLGKWRRIESYVYAVVQVTICVLLLALKGGGERVPPLFLAVLGFAAMFWIGVILPWLRFKWHPVLPVWHGVLGTVLIVPLWLSLVVLKESPAVLLAAMAIVWISDSAAYFAGYRWGRKKLAPEISPGKTWEGVYGALVAVAIYAVATALAWPVENRTHFWALIVLSIILALLGIAGDLFESLMKRQAGVKDSGTLLPGHGGILDRIDALLPAMPVAALAYSFIIH